MAEEKIDDRLSELALAISEAVSVAVRLAQMSEWIEETETVTSAGFSATPDEIGLDSLASIAPDEAIHRLQVTKLSLLFGPPFLFCRKLVIYWCPS